MDALSTSWLQRARRSTAGLVWECRRAGRSFLRRQGWWGVAVLACLMTVLVALFAERSQAAAKREAQRRLAERSQAAPDTPRVPDQPRAKLRLEQFEANLLSPDDLPTQVQDLLNLAEREQLSAARGEYRPQVDVQGRFMRYRISLPVKGEANAVHRFIESALRKHPALGMESVQFQRERIDSPLLEARIQWVALVRLPQGAEPELGTGGVR